MNLSKKILSWYDNNKRTLPWRISQNSKKKQYYRILSEFMLQQTQVKTAIPYFNNFVKKITSLKALSKSSEKKILKLWEGLGYYSRRTAGNDTAEPYSLIFDNKDNVIGIYFYSQNEQSHPWQQVQSTGPFPYPHWGLHFLLQDSTNACS